MTTQSEAEIDWLYIQTIMHSAALTHLYACLCKDLPVDRREAFLKGFESRSHTYQYGRFDVDHEETAEEQQRRRGYTDKNREATAQFLATVRGLLDIPTQLAK